MTQRILVIEDQEDNRRILRDRRTSAGPEVLEALTGEEGVIAAETHRPDLILMDLQLPGLDGYEATRRIKANPAIHHIPILAVTSYALSGDDVKALGAGCDAYVTKPFSPRALLAKIREYLPEVIGEEPLVRRPPRIVIVDDTPDNRDMFQARLAVHGYEILTAANGEGALALATWFLAWPGRWRGCHEVPPV